MKKSEKILAATALLAATESAVRFAGVSADCNGCSGCDNTCSGSCGSGCIGTCANDCNNTCVNHCVACQGQCMDTCKASCQNKCYGCQSCTASCKNYCAENCVGACNNENSASSWGTIVNFLLFDTELFSRKIKGRREVA